MADDKSSLEGLMGDLRTLRDDTAAWLAEHDYESMAQMRGSMNLERVPDAGAYERA